MKRRIALGVAACVVLVGVVSVSIWMKRGVVPDTGVALMFPSSQSPTSSVQAEEPASGVPQSPTSTTTPLTRSWRMVNEPIVHPGELAIRVPVLMYHYVRDLTPNLSLTGQLLSVSPKSFAAQMQELLDLRYHVITPHQLQLALTINQPLPAKPVMITFDDGYRDIYENAWPVLKRLKIPATFFIITHTFASPAYLDSAMLREMDASGLATIAAHTRDHVNVPPLPKEQQLFQVKGSKDDLENLLGHPVLDFAYPYGGVNSSTAQLVKSVGYEMAFSTFLGSLHTPSDLYELRRIRVGDGESLAPILSRFSSK